MLLRSNNTFGDIQAGFMKLIPMYSMKRLKSASISDGFAEEQVIDGSTNPRDRSRSLELDNVSNNKNRSKRKPRSRNNTVKVVNRSQAKAMSSLQALRGTSMPKSISLSPSSSNGARRYSDSSNNSSPPSPYLEEEILPYTLTVDLSDTTHKHHSSKLHSQLEARKVRFH